jgi:dipeptidyl aminopeptidase/acylaminoacyl peptidase
VFVASRVNWDEDRYDRELILVDLAMRAQRKLTYERTGLSDPAFSPDGTSVAFIADKGSGDDATSQVWIMPLNGGDARPVTDAKDGVDQFAWRPDGKALAYVASDPKPERKGAAKFRDSFVFTTEPITAREFPRPAHLFVTDLNSGRARQLTFGAQSVAAGEGQSTISWSPDGATIAFTLTPNAILNDESYSHVALVDVATKAVRPLTSHTAWESNPLFSPDGKLIAYVYSNGDGQVNLNTVYVTTPAGGTGRAISTAFDRNVADVAWLADSSGVYFRAPDRTEAAIVRAPLDGAPERVDMHGVQIASGLDGAVGPQGTLVFVGGETKGPPEVYLRSPSGSVEKITTFNDNIAQLHLASAETITFPTTTGIQGDAVLYTPPDFVAGRKYPLAVFIHGGPTSASTTQFDFWSQVMAGHGWLVLRPNYRGSDNLGLAYQRAVLYDAEDGPGKDIIAAVNAVRARGIVDDARISVSGWSYGGIMTAWMISKYHVWKAAVSGASVNDWSTDYGVADDSLSDRDLFHGSPYATANSAEWRRASAISYAHDVTTPVLILSDVGDNRDPFATSSMYWRALRDNGKDATLRVWPVNGHFPSDPVRTVDVYHYWIGYIAQDY